MIVVRALLSDNARIWALLVTWLMILVLWSALAVYWEATAVFDSSRQTSVVYVDLDDTTCVVLISIPPYSNPTKVRTCGYLLLSISARQDCKTAVGSCALVLRGRSDDGLWTEGAIAAKAARTVAANGMRPPTLLSLLSALYHAA